VADAVLMPRENDIRNYHLDDALEQINQSEYGAHHLIVYSNQMVLRELYTKYVKRQLEDENKTVLMLPHYETTDSLKRVLLGADNDNEDMMKKYEDSLIVMDSIKAHFGADDHMAYVNNLVDSSENGVLVIDDAGPFFHLNKKEKLVEHELSMPSRFDADLKRFCVFHKQDFNTLAEEQRQKLLDHHGQVLIIEDK
jgi:transcriptional regulator with PAS, ATPase and Fis domain